ncbi:hypothetical protein DPMN_194679 [Dreissena polymorpha]|uniref:EGF-like domain-containing protein n=1 Tax=Dreissena polymorpha TaxID=45954 RepID=A0A9D4BDD6_DREPO|nr:hypothetical protein DPMN_194679 [Dreissena polymorpha]
MVDKKMFGLGRGFVYFGILVICSGNHFRGGTITWKSTGHGFEVEFSSKLGWAAGTHCSIATVGSGKNGTEAAWNCEKGCSGTPLVNVNQGSFQCTGFNLAQNWERTEGVFKYTFPGPGPFEIAFSGGAWIVEVGAGSWKLQTTVDLRDRSDTSAPNHSPIIPSKPVYFIKYGCTGDIVLPTIDADNDTVTCRWSVGNECSDICHDNGHAQIATLNEETCTLIINANLKINGTYAVAITIEDRPKATITIGGSSYPAGTIISSVPLQFILVTPDMPSRNCDDKPEFVEPTPSQTDPLVFQIGDVVFLSFYATSRSARITAFTLLDPPLNVQQSALRNDDRFRPGVFAVDLSWIPTGADIGQKKICVEATDEYLLSHQHCVTVTIATVDPCINTLCQHNSTCIRHGYTYLFRCACAHGYTGSRCETDIDECTSAPCQNNATCFDLINEYFCGCHVGYSGVNCQTEIDECLLRPCHNGGTCKDHIGWAKCTCKPGFTGEVCQTGYDICESMPCQNGALTSSYMHYSACDCVVAERRQDRCFQYSRNKHAGYGFLSAIAGIMTAILLYILFDAISNKTLCCYQKTNMVQMEKTIPENKVELHVVEPTEPEPEVETPEKLEAPRIRKHHCWACEVKYNNAPIPAWYEQSSRTYKQ